MLTKKENLAAIENFSQNLEIQGRSLWQDARIRFMRNKAAMVSLFVLMLITLQSSFCRCFPLTVMKIRTGMPCTLDLQRSTGLVLMLLVATSLCARSWVVVSH